MDVIHADDTVLLRLLNSLTSDFVTDKSLQTLKFCNNYYDDDKFDHYLFDFSTEVNLLINNISSVITKPLLVKRLFDNAGEELQLALLLRYNFCFDGLSKHNNKIYYVVPKSLDKLFCWFLIDFFSFNITTIDR